jgi:glycosyltransferase involved in cell wall biosynthesis
MGIKESSGEYISFLDSDDLYLPFRLEEGISLFTKSPEIDIIFSRFGLIGHLIDDRFDYAAKINNGHIFDNLLQGNFICTSTVMLRRRCLNNDAPFDEDKNLISVEDYNLWLKVAFKHNFGFIDKITVKRRQHQNALSADFERMFNADFYNFEKIKSYFLKEHNMDLEKHGNYLMGKFNYRIKFAREYFYFRNYSSARSQFIEALKIRKSNVAAYFFYLLCSLPKSFIEFLRKIV